jgi:hypothetical protein
MSSLAELQDRLTRLEDLISLSGDGILKTNLAKVKAQPSKLTTGKPISVKVSSAAGKETFTLSIPENASLDQLKKAFYKASNCAPERQRFTLGATTVAEGAVSASGVKEGSSLVFRDQGTLPQRLEDLNKAWSQLETPDFTRFYEKYAKARDVLELSVEMKDVALLNETKEATVLASYEDSKRTAQMYQSMEPLKTYMAETPIPDINAVSRDLDQAEAASNAKLAEVVQMHKEVEGFLDRYNKVINLMSQKLLMYNAALTQWEAKN